ncbi:MAG TPA: hypothetical protein VKE50_00290 [Thermoanaerobaculia bacterium]|nr:hypothetical protein [Thermoanaerobaculia bacterium]
MRNGILLARVSKILAADPALAQVGARMDEWAPLASVRSAPSAGGKAREEGVSAKES